MKEPFYFCVGVNCFFKRVRGVESMRANDRCVLWTTVGRLGWWAVQAQVQYTAPALTAWSCDHSGWWGHNAQDPTWAKENLRCYLKLFLNVSHFFHLLLINFRPYRFHLSLVISRLMFLLLPNAFLAVARRGVSQFWTIMGMYFLPPEQRPGPPVVPWEPNSSPEPCDCQKRGCSRWMLCFDGKESIIGAEGGLRGRFLARRPDKCNFGFDSRVIPSGAWRAGSATCCGSWKCTHFPQKPPALPAWRAICLAKTLVLSCRCRPLPVSPRRPAETTLLQHAIQHKWVVKSS